MLSLELRLGQLTNKEEIVTVKKITPILFAQADRTTLEILGGAVRLRKNHRRA